jgi:predicted RNA-binding Zn-ribbon protein involved in translation (DUF1610 family)
MEERRLGDVSTRRCARCHAVWMKEGALSALLYAVGRVYSLADVVAVGKECAARRSALLAGKAVYFPCPACGELMSRRMLGRASYLMTHVCQRHGILIEANDLHLAQEYFARGGDVLERDAVIEEQNRDLAEARLEPGDAAGRRRRRDGPLAWVIHEP